MRDGIKLVCFDVDGTLVDGLSWLILTEGLGCSTDKHIDIFDKALKGEVSYSKSERIITKMYRESGYANEVFIRKLFSEIKIRNEAKELFFYLRKKGYKIYLISAAIDIFVENVAKRLGTDGFYANARLEFDKKGIVKRFHFRSDQSKLKLEQLNELLSNLGLDYDSVAYVGDGYNDIDVFKKIGYGIAVHCFDDNLKKFAWKVVGNLGEIKNIL